MAFELPEPGTYDFEIDRAEFGQSRAGNPTLRVLGRVISEGAMSGRTMFGGYVLNASSVGARVRLKQLVMATGVELDDHGNFHREVLLGRRFTAEVIMRSAITLDSNGFEVGRNFAVWQNERPVLVFEEMLQRLSPEQLEKLYAETEYAANQHMEAAARELGRAAAIRAMIPVPTVKS
jgi:hypothetical protein